MIYELLFESPLGLSEYDMIQRSVRKCVKVNQKRTHQNCLKDVFERRSDTNGES